MLLLASTAHLGYECMDDEQIWEKIFGGSVANIYLGKIMEAFKKIPSSFGVVVRKPGLGVN